MSYRKAAVWLFVGLSLVVAWGLAAPEPSSLLACGLEPFAGEDPFIIYLDGRRRDEIADVVFGGEKWPEVAHTSFVPVVLRPGPGLNVVIAANTDLLVSLTGAVERVRVVHGIEAGGHVAVHGVAREKATFIHSRWCFLRAGWAAGSAPSLANVRRFVLPSEPPKDIACFGLECAATPIRWPRDIALPKVYSFDLLETIADAPLRKPELLDGWGGFAQLVDRGLLRRPNPEEVEFALEQVRLKYLSRFSPQWRPRFGIDFVMVRPTRLPRLDHETGASFREATVLVPETIQVTRQEYHCMVVMGRVAPHKRDHQPALTRLHQSPPYVISPPVDQKCLGDDQSPGPSRFEIADYASAGSVPDCQAVQAKPDEAVIGLYDYRNYGGRPQTVRPLVDIRFTGLKPVVLVARTPDTLRHWRIAEAFQGQVTSFVLAEPFYRTYGIDVDGLTPEQIVIDARRLSAWRKQAHGDPMPFQAYRAARLDDCDHRVSLLNWNPQYIGYEVSERGFDNSVKVWTGRGMDTLKYVDSENQVVIDTDRLN